MSNGRVCQKSKQRGGHGHHSEVASTLIRLAQAIREVDKIVSGAVRGRPAGGTVRARTKVTLTGLQIKIKGGGCEQTVYLVTKFPTTVLEKLQKRLPAWNFADL